MEAGTAEGGVGGSLGRGEGGEVATGSVGGRSEKEWLLREGERDSLRLSVRVAQLLRLFDVSFLLFPSISTFFFSGLILFSLFASPVSSLLFEFPFFSSFFSSLFVFSLFLLLDLSPQYLSSLLSFLSLFLHYLFSFSLVISSFPLSLLSFLLS